MERNLKLIIFIYFLILACWNIDCFDKKSAELIGKNYIVTEYNFVDSLISAIPYIGNMSVKIDDELDLEIPGHTSNEKNRLGRIDIEDINLDNMLSIHNQQTVWLNGSYKEFRNE